MVLPTETISFSQINSELRRSPSAELDADDEELRVLAGQETGTVNISNARGKSIVGRTTETNIAVDVDGFNEGEAAVAGNLWQGNGVLSTIRTGSEFNGFLGPGPEVIEDVQNLNGLPTRWSMVTNPVLGSQYQIRAINITGFGGGIIGLGPEGSWSLDTWTTIGEGRSIQVFAPSTSDFFASYSLLVQIRTLSSSIVVASSELSLTASRLDAGFPL